MQTVNNYNMEWERPGEGAFTERGSGVFNGDIGPGGGGSISPPAA